jgi:hypothetical protein
VHMLEERLSLLLSNDELHYLVEDLAKRDKRLIGAHRSEEMWQASGGLSYGLRHSPLCLAPAVRWIVLSPAQCQCWWLIILVIATILVGPIEVIVNPVSVGAVRTNNRVQEVGKQAI